MDEWIEGVEMRWRGAVEGDSQRQFTEMEGLEKRRQKLGV